MTVALSTGPGPLAGTTNYNIGTGGGNGVVSFSNLQINSTGTGDQLTATAAPAYGAPVAGAMIWLDANSASSVLTNGTGSVTNWLDLSGNGNNFNQLVGTAFIGYTNRTTPSGRPTVTFTNGLLRNATYRNVGSTISVFVVTKKRTAGNSNGSQYQGPVAATDGVNQDYNITDAFSMDYGGSENTPVVERNSGGPNFGTYEPSTAYHDFEYIANTTANTLYINGGGGNTGGTTGAFAITNISVGGRVSGPQNLDGDVAEVLVYNTALSTGDRQSVETYLSNKWMTASFTIVPSNAVTAAFNVSAPPVNTTVESAADGSGVVVPLQNLTAGVSTNVYAIVRTNGTFLSNTIAAWSLQNVTGGVVAGDLTTNAAGTMATFTANKAGGAVIQAVANSAVGQSGVQTVVAGSPSQTTVESKADGSGVPVPAQNLAAGAATNVYSIARDAEGNFIGNVAAAWSLQSVTGGVAGGDLAAAGDSKSATFTGHAGRERGDSGGGERVHRPVRRHYGHGRRGDAVDLDHASPPMPRPERPLARSRFCRRRINSAIPRRAAWPPPNW